MAPSIIVEDSQAGLLAKKFLVLSAKLKKLQEFIRSLPSPSTSEVITSVPFRLQQNLLPSLRHRLTVLSMVLEPKELSKDSSGKWQAASKLLAELDGQLEELKNSVDSMLWNSEPVHENQKRVTSTRCEELRELIGNLFGTIAPLCDQYAAFVADCKDSIVSAEQSGRQGLLQSTAIAWRVIDEAIAWLRQSDFKVMQNGLQKTVGVIDDALEELMQLICSRSLEHMGSNLSLGGRDGPESDVDEQVLNGGALPEQGGGNEAPIEEQEPNVPQEEGSQGSSDEEGGLDNPEVIDDREVLSEDEIARATLAIPLLKLIRLFVNKISKPTNSGPKMCSHMSPCQLVLLLKLVNYASAHADDLVCALGNLPHNSSEITEAVTGLMSDSAGIVKLINIYLDMLASPFYAPCAKSASSIPPAPSTSSAPSPLVPPDSLATPQTIASAPDKEVLEGQRKWCRVWGDQFHQAALHLLDTCDHE